MSESTQPAARPRRYKTPKRGQRKVLVGTVLPNKMAKTITVEVSRTEKHRKYKKYIERHTKVYAHDPQETAQPGDVVKVVESRPFSKLKRFALLEIVKKAGA